MRVRPFESTRVRSLRKLPKAYLWDWSEVTPPGPRFENLVALHLLKFCHVLQDREGHRVDLQATRDVVEQGVRCLPAATFLSALV